MGTHPGDRQTGPGEWKTWRVIGFDCDTPPIEYENVPLLPSANASVAVPTGVANTFVESKGAAFQAGPVPV
jgi:hypothetical protein